MLEELGIDKPRISFARKHARKAFAECKHLFPLGFPADIEIAIQFILPGFQIFGLDNLPSEHSGITYLDEKLIGYNKKHAETRIRFTLAHEAGHIRLDHTYSIVNEYGGDDTVFEKEANAFAGEFLIPLDALKEALKTIQDPKALALHFKVSRDVIIIRLQSARLF